MSEMTQQVELRSREIALPTLLPGHLQAKDVMDLSQGGLVGVEHLATEEGVYAVCLGSLPFSSLSMGWMDQ